MSFPWRRWILGDWQIKLTGLVVALSLWTYVRTGQMLHLTLNVPLELRNPPQAMRLTRKPPSRIEVRLAAHRDLISRLEPRTVRAVVDLTEVTRSSVSITLTPEHIVRPEGISVLNIRPSQLILDFVPSKRSKASRKGRARR